MFFSSIKRNLNDGVIVFVKHYLSLEFFEYNFVDSNVVKLNFPNTVVPINILCVYRSPNTDNYVFIKTLSDLIKENNYSNTLTVISGDMDINIVGVQEKKIINI